MLNEGMTTGGLPTEIKSVMIREIRNLGKTDSDHWERAVFEALTGQSRDEIDWDFEDNKAGYFTWVKTFDGLVNELVDDGYVKLEVEDDKPVLVPVERDPEVGYSQG